MSARRSAIRLERPSVARLPAFLELAGEFAAHAEPRYEAALRDPEAYLQRLARIAAGVNLPVEARALGLSRVLITCELSNRFGDSAPSRQSCCACSGHSRP
jgi:predicted acetyltransferase